jgi:hypothetical protein
MRRRAPALGWAAMAIVAIGQAHAQESPGSARERLLAHPEVLQWLDHQYTGAERDALGAGDLTITGARCGCSDRPNPHYPYAMVIVSSPKGDLIARFEGDEGAMRIRPLAYRSGLLYCSIYASEGCFGEFADPCDFTDARYGPALAPYFPDCKG